LLRFIQLLLDGPRDGRFILKDLPGSGKRIDLLCRDLAACFDWGPDQWPRNALELIVLLPEDVALLFHHPGGRIPVGERAWAEEIQSVLDGNDSDLIEKQSVDTKELLRSLLAEENSSLWVLEESGPDIRSITNLDVEAQNSFILGDHQGFGKDILHMISQLDISPISLGPHSYLSSHCIASVISEMEGMKNR
jgi:tRNA (pseudouridine54-N1)-methyltransferase